MRGASLCPRKIFAEAFIDSAAVVPIVICKMMGGQKIVLNFIIKYVC